MRTADEVFHALSAYLQAQQSERDEQEFIERHGGSVTDVMQRDRTRTQWTLNLLKRTRT